MKKNYTWLQISDLHIFQSTDWNIMKDSYKKLAKVINPDFIVVTGDYRHKKKNPNYENALIFLNEIVKIFNVSKTDVFLVPGNHDVNDFDYKEEIIVTIRSSIETNADAYLKYMNGDKSLLKAFDEYNTFVRKFYNNEIDDARVKTPSDVISVKWRNLINIVVLNTALISEGKQNETEIIDINALSNLDVDITLPTIVLAHHNIDCLTQSHMKRAENILNKINTKVYLCGDAHKIDKKNIAKTNTPNTSTPVFVCGKSAIEIGDNYSDLSVIKYQSMNDGKVYVQVYKYEDMNFVETSDFYYDVNKRYNFQFDDVIDYKEKSAKNKKENIEGGSEKHPVSIWLPDAELAKGKQTRFKSFTETDEILKFFDNDSGYLGIASVKGIGKTFLLQVKRVKSSRRYYCLPVCTRPSIKNNWATERISFDSYANLKTENIYDDLVILWKFAIKCYVINHFKNDENNKTVYEYVKSDKISKEIASFCVDEHNDNLESIIENIINIKKWNEEIARYSIHISNLCKQVLKKRKKAQPSAKDIAIFIDKVDQAIKQTNAEPPADCVVCKKKDNYIECNSSRKSPQYCGTESGGCQSKNCCYGCEIFAGPKSNDGLRIYENSNSAKCVHVNIWQYLQLALMNAAGQISDEFNGEINVFYTIRQESFNCEENRLGEQNQKISGKIIKLAYSLEEHHKIFLECIQEQDPFYLFQPDLKDKSGFEEYAFVGVNNLCHPYCSDIDGNPLNESVFSSIYRHSFDRSRDIQRYGEELTKNINKIRECKGEQERGELVKEIIENLAAKLAYCSKQSESTVNPSYYTEKMHYLPNYWAYNENFEKLLSLIDKNLLFDDDIKSICKKINNVEHCPIGGCRNGSCKRHPFSMLFNMGYLGYILPNLNNKNAEVQHFLDAGDISYFAECDNLMTANRVAYIIHPALTKTIEKKYNKNFSHFSGFILGKGLRVNSNIISKMIEDKKELNEEEFLSKYYYKPE